MLKVVPYLYSIEDIIKTSVKEIYWRTALHLLNFSVVLHLTLLPLIFQEELGMSNCQN